MISMEMLQHFIELGARRKVMDVTPPLDDFLEEYEVDHKIWWRIECGHHQNLFEAAVMRMEQAEIELYNLRHAVKAANDLLGGPA